MTCQEVTYLNKNRVKVVITDRYWAGKVHIRACKEVRMSLCSLLSRLNIGSLQMLTLQRCWPDCAWLARGWGYQIHQD